MLNPPTMMKVLKNCAVKAPQILIGRGEAEIELLA
jgi:hypothetical protein